MGAVCSCAHISQHSGALSSGPAGHVLSLSLQVFGNVSVVDGAGAVNNLLELIQYQSALLRQQTIALSALSAAVVGLQSSMSLRRGSLLVGLSAAQTSVSAGSTVEFDTMLFQGGSAALITFDSWTGVVTLSAPASSALGGLSSPVLCELESALLTLFTVADGYLETSWVNVGPASTIGVSSHVDNVMRNSAAGGSAQAKAVVTLSLGQTQQVKLNVVQLLNVMEIHPSQYSWAHVQCF